MTTDPRPRVLVTFGSKRGGTAEIAKVIADILRERGLAVDCTPAAAARDVATYDAVIVGGAPYARRWYREARRFVTHHALELRGRPVWMFSSGPLDTSANRATLPPVPRVAALMARVGARGHATFGGRLAPDAQGFVASAMAKTHAGDWRDWEEIREWALKIAHAVMSLPQVEIAAPVARPARRLLAGLCLAVGVTAIAGGIALVARPSGSLVHMPVSTLSHTPFSSFLIPGLLLLVVIGVGNMLAGALVLGDAPIANVAAFAGGAALLTWIVAQMLLLRTANVLQLGYFIVAVVIMAEAVRRHASTAPGLHKARSAGDHRQLARFVK
jgi:menaquinone-dependent protoporphyrinogen oxidase